VHHKKRPAEPGRARCSVAAFRHAHGVLQKIAFKRLILALIDLVDNVCSASESPLASSRLFTRLLVESVARLGYKYLCEMVWEMKTTVQG
jgi:hypothetical protein